MKPAIAITLILCGTLVAAMPIIAHHDGLQMADIGSLFYFGLGAIMILSAVIASVVRPKVNEQRGFEPLPVE